jgi:hypothetical protein
VEYIKRFFARVEMSFGKCVSDIAQGLVGTRLMQYGATSTPSDNRFLMRDHHHLGMIFFDLFE